MYSASKQIPTNLKNTLIPNSSEELIKAYNLYGSSQNFPKNKFDFILLAGKNLENGYPGTLQSTSP